MKDRSTIRRAFYRSLTLTVCFTSSVLAMAEGAWLPVGLTPFLAVLALWLNDHRRSLVLPTMIANAFGIIALSAAAIELLFGGTEARILSAVHLVTYITWIVLFMDKQHRQRWWLLALCVLQLALSSVLTRSALLPTFQIILMFLMVWTLSLFTLYRLQQRVSLGDEWRATRGRQQMAAVTVRYGIQADASLKWTGLRFRGMILTMCLASLLMSGAVFAVFPRVFVGSPVNLGTGSLENSGIINRTGFREEVVLGEIGILLKSEERVLQLSVFHQPTNRPINPEEFAGIMEMDELVLRGTSMGHYAKGRWDRGEALQGYLRAESNRHHLGRRGSVFDCYRVEVIQDPPVGNFAFAPRPVTSAQLINAKGRIVERSLTHTLVFDMDREESWGSDRSLEFNREPISYEIYCPAPETYRKLNPPILLSDRIRRWAFPNAPSRSWLQKEDHLAKQYAITRDLQESLPDLSRLAAELCQQDDGLLPVEECAERIVSLLRDSGNFRYSLDVPRTTSGVDPAEDFLLNHRTGHCQYFASACALMLQSLNIPARIVNGFKGGEVNPETGKMLVRQKHAHVWVEYRHQQRWVRIDPTPAARNEVVASIQQTPLLGNLEDAASELWTASMDNVTAERQREFIQPIIDFANQIVKDIRRQGLWAALQNRIRNHSQWFNWRVFVGGFAAMLLVATLVRRRIWRLIRSLSVFVLERLSSRRRVASSIVRFYESFCRLCAQQGLEFPPSGTATENALSAANFFDDRLDSTTRMIPVRIASAFNAVRYGDHLLTEQQTAQLAQDVVRLTQALRKEPRQTTQQA